MMARTSRSQAETLRLSGQYGKTTLKKRKRGRLVRGRPWSCILFKLHKSTWRGLLRTPWERPVLAIHIAAVQIQRIFRAHLVRAGKALLGKSQRRMSNTRRSTGGSRRAPKQLRKYMASVEAGKTPEGMGFSDWCATRIAAWYAMIKAAYEYRLRRHRMYLLAAAEIQLSWRTYRTKRLERRSPHGSSSGSASSRKVNAARKIQRVWRRAVNVRIFKYYRDMIASHMSCDPAVVLRHINAAEAELAARDAAMAIKIRFRLGGSSFPPVLYYKMFTESPLCDVNAFAPRNYARERVLPSPGRRLKPSLADEGQRGSLRVGRSTFAAVIQDGKSLNAATRSYWYHRRENNGWRPVVFRASWPTGLLDFRAVSAASSPEVSAQPFHFSKLRRREEVILRRKLRKRAWMAHLYRGGMLQEMRMHADSLDQCGPSCVENEARHDLQWSSELNYDAYVAHWHTVASTECSGRRLDGYDVDGEGAYEVTHRV